MINTLDYGSIRVFKDSTSCKNATLDTIDGCSGEFYEIKQTFTGEIVAFELEA
jgi:hypothetical protein